MSERVGQLQRASFQTAQQEAVPGLQSLIHMNLLPHLGCTEAGGVMVRETR